MPSYIGRAVEKEREREGGFSGGIAKQYGESIRIRAIVLICHAYLAHT